MAKDEVVKKLDRLIDYVTLELRTDLREDFVTNDEFQKAHRELIGLLEQQSTILARLDQKRILLKIA